MPKNNFANTVIYKLECKTPGSTECIFGYTGNVYSFKFNLKRDCLNGKKGDIYKQINDNGGYDNWEFTVVESFPECTCKIDAMNKVQSVKRTHLSKALPEPPRFLPILQNCVIETRDSIEVSDKICAYCGQQFTRTDNLSRHQKKSCKQNNIINVTQQRQIEKLQKQLEKQQEEIERLKSKPDQTINNNNTNNIQNNIQNNTQNNITIEIGDENISEVLTRKQKMNILSKNYDSIDYITEVVHCNPKLPQFRSVQISSLSKPYCKVFSKKHNKFITKKTKDVFEKMVAHRTDDIETFLADAKQNGDYVSEITENAIKGMVQKLSEDEQFKKQKLEQMRYTVFNHNNSISV